MQILQIKHTLIFLFTKTTLVNFLVGNAVRNNPYDKGLSDIARALLFV
jgi:hypothetical protein